MNENYDLEGSPTFSVWKKLYSAKEDSVASATVELQGATAEGLNVASSSTGATAGRSSRVTSSSTAAPITSETPSTGVQINSSASVLREILTYPTLEATGPP